MMFGNMSSKLLDPGGGIYQVQTFALGQESYHLRFHLQALSDL